MNRLSCFADALITATVYLVGVALCCPLLALGGAYSLFPRIGAVMSMRPRNNKPGVRGQSRVECEGMAAYLNHVAPLYGTSRASAYLPKGWHDRLPDPAVYYAKHLSKLSKVSSNGWAMALCPFHDDHSPSLSVKLVSVNGAYRCHTCGAHGDMVAFHMARTKLPFKEAVRSLIGLRARA